VILSSIVFGVLIFNGAANYYKTFNPELSGFGRNTIGWESSYNGDLLSTVGDIPSVHLSFKKFRSESKKIVLWLGASQLQGINQYKPGDELAVYYAHQRAHDRGSDYSYLQVAYPNANFNELLATYIKFRHVNKIPDWLVIGVTYDDLRESGIRYYVLRNLPDIGNLEFPQPSKGLQNLISVQKNKDKDKDTEIVAYHATADTPQEKFEEILNNVLAENWEAFSNRNKLSAIISINTKTYAGLSFGWIMSPFLGRINPVLAVPKDIKQWNEDGLDALLGLAKSDSVNVLLYRVAHPEYEGDFYHDRRNYENYFSNLKSSYLDENVYYQDLEKIIPLKYWGLNNTGRLDVFHFQAGGHQLLGEKIDEFFEDIENNNAF